MTGASPTPEPRGGGAGRQALLFDSLLHAAKDVLELREVMFNSHLRLVHDAALVRLQAVVATCDGPAAASRERGL